MSRVGKLPVKIAQGVKVSIQDGVLKVEGPKGKLSQALPEGVNVEIKSDEVQVSKGEGDPQKVRALYGTVRSLVQNMVKGVSTGFVREMDIQGVGYRAAVKGKVLQLTLGFSHPVEYQLPEGVTAKVDKNTHLILECADKVTLGMAAAKIRSFRPPEPYQGKGVRYSDERINRKQGKAAGAK